MPLFIISVLVTLGLTYIWLTRGFFSALIHLVCTIIAGAIAFAFWEPLSYAILDSSPTGGFMSFTSGVAFAVGLIVPFVVSLIILRLSIDKLLPANVVLDPKIDYVGGGVCGLMIGVLTAGILGISLGFLRMDSDFPNQPLEYGSGGTIRRTSNLAFPADKLVAKLYGSLSEHAFHTDTPLAKWHPDLHEEGASMRINFGDGRARNTLRSNEFAVLSRFTVTQSSGDLGSLLKDRWETATQSYADINGNPVTKGSIEGYVVDFKPAAKEKDGKVVVGAGQVRLIVENDNDERQTIFPVAVSSQADSAKTTPARWRYNAKDTYIASVGGGIDALFAFEFVCPQGYHPVALYVKGVRSDQASPSFDAASPPKMKFSSSGERDAWIAGGFSGSGAAAKGGGGDVDYSAALKLARPTQQGNTNLQPPEGMRISENLPFIIQKGIPGVNFDLDEENNKNIILNGDAVLPPDTSNKGLEKPIQIQRLLTTPDTIVVQLDVSGTSKMSLVNKFDMEGAPSLYDTTGTAYAPVGFIYQDETKIKVSFKPGEPITALSQLDTLSKSRPSQKMTLIYRCSKGVTLKGFGVGTKALVTFDPPVLLDQTQGRQ